MRTHPPATNRARVSRARFSETRWVRYPGTCLDIGFLDADAVEQALGRALKGWLPGPAPEPAQEPALAGAAPAMPRANDATPAIARVARMDDGYATHSSYLHAALQGLGVAGAACAVIADLSQAYYDARPGCIALHCGAFRYRGRLFAMTGPARAGKSTLTARLAAEPDFEIFCDDVLPVLPDGQATALGIAPRLRLPLPPDSAGQFRHYVDRHLGPRDARYGYLCAPSVVAHGLQSPLAGLLILDRRADGPARLHSVTEDEALRALLLQNMADLDTAEIALRRMTDLVRGMTCLRLVYSDIEDAAHLIRRAFESGATMPQDILIGPALSPRNDAAPSHRQPEVDPETCWQRDPDVMLQSSGDAAFLWKPGRQQLWHLNPLAAAIWTMLELPGSATELGAVLSDEFPDQPAATIVADVTALLAALARAGMIHAARARA
jgi:hypothetical protein